jgi:hypothetical protein
MLRGVLATSLVLSTFAAAIAVACSGSESTPPPNAAPTTSELFRPAGCAYDVARPKTYEEFPPFEAHAEVATPGAIKFVRRGLGGDVRPEVTAGRADPSTSFAIGWQTDVATRATQIRFGDTPERLDRVIDGASYVVAGQGGGPDVRFHEVHVCGVEPGRTYHYQVGGAGVWSPVHTTTTAPAPGSDDPVTIGFVGDSRDALGRSQLPVFRAIAGRYAAAAVPTVLFSGDMVLVGTDQSMWDVWSSASEAAAPSVFFALAPGNHENEQIRFFAHAVMPGAPTANAERYSSFDHGPVHVVMIDDYAGIVSPAADPAGNRDELLAWLDADLAKANGNRATVPWIVTFHHHPVYSDTTNASRAKETERVREALLALYDRHRVDLDLAGHDHFYERFEPLRAGAKAEGGTTYLICAAAGAPSYQLKPERPLAAFATEYDPDRGEGIYGTFTASKTKLEVTVRKLVVGTGTSPADDAVIDRFELSRPGS